MQNAIEDHSANAASGGVTAYDVMQKIAAQWDGCMCQLAVVGMVDVGEAIRKDWALYGGTAQGAVTADVPVDALRYRHLRACRGMEHDPLFSVRDEDGWVLWGADLDHAVDESIAFSRDIYTAANHQGAEQ